MGFSQRTKLNGADYKSKDTLSLVHKSASFAVCRTGQ